MDNEFTEPGSVTTTIMQPVDMVFDGWIVMNASQLWSDLRYRVGTDDRRTNMSFNLPPTGCVLVALPTRDNPPEPPTEWEGMGVITLEEYFHAVVEVMKTNERVRKTIIDQLSSNF